MKPFLPAFAFIILASSCTNYQYLTLNADKATKNEKKEIVWENDSLKLVYNFNGRWGYMNIAAYNKTNEPLYINWKKSAIIHNDKSTTLFDPTVKLSGKMIHVPETFLRDTPTTWVNASFKLSDGMAFMPPQAYITRSQIDVTQARLTLTPISENIPAQKIDHEHGMIKLRTAKFDAATSPLKFRIYLTFATGADNREFSLEHFLYATEAKQSENGPYPQFINNDGDKFYSRLQ